MIKIKFILLIFVIVSLFSCNPERSHSTDKEQVVSSKASPVSKRTAEFNEDKNAYFGDLHVHTSWSFDAFIYNVRTDPNDAYNFGKGMAINHYSYGKIKAKRPLDFMAVTDHAEYMGVMKQMIDKDSPMFDLEMARRVRSEDRTVSVRAFGEMGISLARNEPIKQLMNSEVMKTTWDRVVQAANDHYEPGKFTTFPAYEWTSSPSDGGAIDPRNGFARNLHRNVIYKSSNVSETPFSSFDSQNPEELWEWMEKEKSKGIELMAIPHNANMSDGLMYPKQTFDGRPIDAKYAKLRHDNEPINEVVQIKGQSMSHPILSPNDEFADFEIYAYAFAIGPPPRSNPANSNVRQALGEGLKIEKELGVNPYKFGVIGSSDGHNSAGAFEEDNYFGKFGNRDGSAQSRLQAKDANVAFTTVEMSAAGLAGVWAEENTRESIYGALNRKESFATSGTRIQLRFFGGNNLNSKIFGKDNWVSEAYDLAVPMGSDLSANEKAPSFLIWAIKDPEGARLDRAQIIKSTYDNEGSIKEKIFEVAWSDDRKIVDGKLEPVGNTVDVKDASYTNTIGANQLRTVWTDPDFDPTESAVYLLRVLEIPTPRWSTYDAKELGIEIPENLDATVQERAWSSPIWYTPKG